MQCKHKTSLNSALYHSDLICESYLSVIYSSFRLNRPKDFGCEWPPLISTLLSGETPLIPLNYDREHCIEEKSREFHLIFLNVPKTSSSEFCLPKARSDGTLRKIMLYAWDFDQLEMYFAIMQPSDGGRIQWSHGIWVIVTLSLTIAHSLSLAGCFVFEILSSLIIHWEGLSRARPQWVSTTSRVRSCDRHPRAARTDEFSRHKPFVLCAPTYYELITKTTPCSAEVSLCCGRCLISGLHEHMRINTNKRPSYLKENRPKRWSFTT